jgi:hypothetical protein
MSAAQLVEALHGWPYFSPYTELYDNIPGIEIHHLLSRSHPHHSVNPDGIGNTIPDWIAAARQVTRTSIKYKAWAIVV